MLLIQAYRTNIYAHNIEQKGTVKGLNKML